MPITNRAEAKDGGFAQVREALVAFEGDVVEADAKGQKTEFSMWGAGTNPDGTPKAPKEFFQIVCVNVVPTEVTEELSMDITEGWTFRENCSDYKGSFWVEAFLASADKNKVQIPDGIIGKRVLFKRFTLEAKDKNGQPNPKFNSTNYIIEKIVSKGASTAPKVVAKTAKPAAQTVAASPQVAIEEVAEEVPPAEPNAGADPMAVALELAIGKTEAQFRSAVALHPLFANSPLLPLAKAGAITATLVTEGKLKLATVNGKQIYQRG